MGHTFMAKIDPTENSSTFYVKFSDPAKNVRALYDNIANEAEFLSDTFRREFLLLKLLNLLGFKTPTETALISYGEDSIIIKRSAGDGENRSTTAHPFSRTDRGYQRRLEIITRTLGIEDVDYERENAIPIRGRGYLAPKIRPALVDPMLGAPKSHLKVISEIGSIQDPQEIRDLKKISYFYEKNYTQIRPIMEELDTQFSKVVAERSLMIKGSNPSRKLESIVREIDIKGFELGVDSYRPKPNGTYVARKVPPIINNESISLILNSIREASEIARAKIPENFDATVEIYSAVEGCGEAYERNFDFNQSINLPFKKNLEPFTSKLKQVSTPENIQRT